MALSYISNLYCAIQNGHRVFQSGVVHMCVARRPGDRLRTGCFLNDLKAYARLCKSRAKRVTQIVPAEVFYFRVLNAASYHFLLSPMPNTTSSGELLGRSAARRVVRRRRKGQHLTPFCTPLNTQAVSKRIARFQPTTLRFNVSAAHPEQLLPPSRTTSSARRDALVWPLLDTSRLLLTDLRGHPPRSDRPHP
jgi:hypothetical protein